VTQTSQNYAAFSALNPFFDVIETGLAALFQSSPSKTVKLFTGEITWTP
jgi:hypothetical protein